jgi:hypothetical protein
MVPFSRLTAENDAVPPLLAKTGAKTVSFVQKTLEYCGQNPELVPRFLDVNELTVDTQATEFSLAPQVKSTPANPETIHSILREAILSLTFSSQGN